MRRLGIASLVALMAVGAAVLAGPGTAAGSGDAAAGPGASTAAKKLSPKVKRQLRRAHRLMRHGKERKARRIGRKIRKRKVPLRRRNRSKCITINACKASALASASASASARAPSCGTASGQAIYDVDVLGFDAFKPSFSKSYCWRKGKITSLGGASVESNVTTFGSVINIRYDGEIYNDSRWRNWRGERHGSRVLVKVLQYTGCTGIPNVGGCLFPKEWKAGLALILQGNGTYKFGHSGD